MNKILSVLMACAVALSAQEPIKLKALSAKASEADQKKKLSVENCIEYAYKNSPELKRLDLRLSNRKYDTIIAKAAFDLGISLRSQQNTETLVDSHSLTLNQQIPGGFSLNVNGRTSFNDISNTQDANLSIVLSKVLLGGGSLEDSLENVRDGLVDELIARNNIRREKRNISFRVKRQFYRIIRNTQGLDIQQRRLQRSKKNLEHAKERDKPLDIATAEIDIPETELNVLAAQRRIATELDTLKVLMGMPADNSIQISEEFSFKEVQPSLKEDLMFAEKFEERFVNNELNKEKIKRDVRIAKERNNVDLSVSLAHNVASEGPDSANLHGRDEQVLALNLSWDLGQRADKARLAIRKNNLDDNAVEKYILRQSKMRTLRDLNRRLIENGKSVKIQELRIKLNDRQVELFKDRWENGEIDILEYIRSQNRLEDSKVEHINLKSNYMELLAEYLFEVGK